MSNHKLSYKISDDLWRSIFELSGDAMFIVDFDTAEIIAANEAAVKLFKAKEKSVFIGHNGAEYHNGEWTEENRNFLENRIKEGNTEDLEILYDDFEGGSFWGKASFKMIDAEQNIYLVRVIDITDLKEIKQEIEAKEEYYNSLMAHSYEGYIHYDLEGNVIHASDKVYKWFGISDLSDLKAEDLVYQDDWELANSAAKRLFEDPDLKSVQAQHRVKKADGSIVWVEVSLTKIINKEGKWVGNISNFRDITERKHAVDQLLKQERLYKLLAENSSDVITLLDKRLNFTFVSPSAFEVFGYKADYLLNRSFLDLLETEEANRVFENFLATPDKIKSLRAFEYKLESDDKKIKWIKATVKPIFKFNELDQIQIVHHDFSEMKEMNLEIAAKDTKFQNLIKTMDEGTIQIDEDGKITFANNKFMELVGLSEEEVVGTEASELMFSNEGENAAGLKLLSIDSKGFKNQYELKYEKKDGNNMWLWANGTPVYADEGVVVGSFVIYNDITARKLSELKLVSAILETQESERSRLAEELHDSLGQILTAIKLNLNALRPAEEDLAKMAVYENLTLHTEQAIQETRNISHNLMPKSLHDFGLDYALEIMFERINKAGSLKIIFDKEVDIDGGFQYNINVYRMVQEAINNSMKHAKASRIDVAFLKGKEFDVCVEIADNGKGFDVSRAMRYGGLGLRNLIRRAEFIGGTCKISSEEQSGTKVLFDLPLST